MQYDTQVDPLVGQTITNPVNTPTVVSPITVSPADVYSASNINSTTSTDPYDLLNVRSNINTALGIPDAQKAYNEQYAKLTNSQNVADAQQLTLEGQVKNLNAIRGEQAQASQLANYGITAQQRVLESVANRLTGLKSEAEAQFGIRSSEILQTKEIMLQYPGAKIKFGDSMDSITKKLTDYADEQKKDAEKDAYKSALRALGLKTSGSRKELESRLSKANKKAKSQADKVASLQLEQLQMSIDNTRSTISNRNSATTTTNNPASYFNSSNSSNSSNSTPTTNYNDPLSPWDNVG